MAKTDWRTRSRTFIWPGSGLNQKSLIYKEDAARACLGALRLPGIRRRSIQCLSAACDHERNRISPFAKRLAALFLVLRFPCLC